MIICKRGYFIFSGYGRVFFVSFLKNGNNCFLKILVR